MQRQTDEDRRREREKQLRHARLFLRWWPVTFTAWLAAANLMVVAFLQKPDWQGAGILGSAFGSFFWLYGWRLEARQVAADTKAKPRFVAGLMFAGFWMMLSGQMLGSSLHRGHVFGGIIGVLFFLLAGAVAVVGLREARREERVQAAR